MHYTSFTNESSKKIYNLNTVLYYYSKTTLWKCITIQLFTTVTIIIQTFFARYVALQNNNHQTNIHLGSLNLKVSRAS